MKCDRPECKRAADDDSAHMICVEIKSYRINTQRWWGFCGAKCRDKWYDAGDDADLLPVSEAPEHLNTSDRDIEYQVHHVTKQGKDRAPLIEGREALRHEGPSSVNAYWRTPAGG